MILKIVDYNESFDIRMVYYNNDTKISISFSEKHVLVYNRNSHISLSGMSGKENCKLLTMFLYPHSNNLRYRYFSTQNSL